MDMIQTRFLRTLLTRILRSLSLEKSEPKVLQTISRGGWNSRSKIQTKLPKMALSHCFREKLLVKTDQRGQTSKRKQKCKQKVPPDHATVRLVIIKI